MTSSTLLPTSEIHQGNDESASVAPQQGSGAPVVAAPANSHVPMVTTRVGITFVGIAIACLGFGLSSIWMADKGFNALMWVAAIASCSLAGLITIRSVRTLRTIESELRRVTGKPERWQSVRPIIGNDRITIGWNELLSKAQAQSGVNVKVRDAASLDKEAVTMARAMRGLPIPWAITDNQGKVRFIGPATCGLFGLASDADHEGRCMLELIGLEAPDAEDADEKKQKILSNIRIINLRVSLPLKERSLELRISRSRLGGRTGDGEGMAWVLSDVTQQHLATKSRDEFLMTATHELRTPLTNLQAYAEALQEEEGVDVENQKEFCNVIVSESRRLSRLVDQLLTVGQLQAGSMVVNRHELEIRPMIEYATDQMLAQANQKSQSLTAELDAKIPTVMGDREKLQAALVNLVANAVKYTPDGGTISVRGGVEANSICIQIQDDGPGIPQDEHEKIFERFYRGEATEHDEKGNGLGLAFTREVARMHGGDVVLESEAGAGSTFTLRLPVGGQSRSAI